jgi:hypothetical protein
MVWRDRISWNYSELRVNRPRSRPPRNLDETDYLEPVKQYQDPILGYAAQAQIGEEDLVMADAQSKPVLDGVESANTHDAVLAAI